MATKQPKTAEVNPMQPTEIVVKQVTDTVTLDPNDINFDDAKNGRYDAIAQTAVESLAWSMFKFGQMQPVEIRGNKLGGYDLTSGYTRVKAARLIRTGFVGPDDKKYSKPDFMIKATIRAAKDTETLRRNILENVKRNDATPMCHAKNIQRLIEAGDSQPEIAKLFGWDQPKISRHYGLMTLETPVQRLIYEGTLSASVGFELAKKANKLTVDDVNSLLKKFANQPTIADVQNFIRERDAKNAKPAATPVTATPSIAAWKTGTAPDDLPASHANPANVPGNKLTLSIGTTTPVSVPPQPVRKVARNYQQTREFVESFIGPGSNKITQLIMKATYEYMRGVMDDIEASALIRVAEMELEKAGIGMDTGMRVTDKPKA